MNIKYKLVIPYLMLIIIVFFNRCQRETSEYQVAYMIPTNWDLALNSKVVGIDISAPDDYHTTQITLSKWFAGLNSSARSESYLTDFHGAFSFTKRLNDSETLDVCDGMYYFFTLNYTTPSGNPGIFIGQTQLIQPASKRTPQGNIEQGQCTAEIPGPTE